MSKNVEDILRLTPTQSAFLYHHLQGGRDGGVLRLEALIEGPLDVRRFASAWRETSRRHPALRSSIHWRDLEHPVQVVHREAPPEVERIDAAGSPEGRESGGDDQPWIRLELGHAPVMRLQLRRLSDGNHRLIWHCHHILLDGWSGGLVIREVFQRYGNPGTGEPLEGEGPPTMRHYLEWLRSCDRKRAAEFWREELVDFPVAAPPAGTSRGPDSPEMNASRQLTALDEDLAALMEQTARRFRVTPNTLCLAALGLVLAEPGRGGQRQVILGMATSGRTAPIAGIEHSVGSFANTLPLPISFDPAATPEEFLHSLGRRRQSIERFEHVSLEDIHRWTGIPARTPLFRTFFVHANFPWGSARSGEGPDAIRLVDFQGGVTSASPLTVLLRPGAPITVEAVAEPGGPVTGSAGELLERFVAALRQLPAATTVGGICDSVALPGPAPDLRISMEAGREPGSQTGTCPATRDRLEDLIHFVWKEVFTLEEMSLDSDFFAAGGNSVVAAHLTSRLGEVLGRRLPLDLVFRAPTVRQMADRLRKDTESDAWPLVVPIRAGGDRPPIFLVHNLGGGIYAYAQLARFLPADQPVFGIQAPLEPCTDLVEMSSRYVLEVRRRFPRGPYLLGGFCFGGAVAYEMARQLAEQGERISLLVVIDAMFPSLVEKRLDYWVAALRQQSLSELASRVRRNAARVSNRLARALSAGTQQGLRVELNDVIDWSAYPEAYRRAGEIHFRALRDYRPKPYPGDLVLIRSRSEVADYDPALGWNRIVQGEVEIRAIDATHDRIMDEGHTRAVAAELEQALSRSCAGDA